MTLDFVPKSELLNPDSGKFLFGNFAATKRKTSSANRLHEFARSGIRIA